VSRSTGVDVLTGAGLDAAFDGVHAVIDVVNTALSERDTAERFFAAETEQVLAAEARAGVGHHVLLSIVGIDKVEGNAHYAGKRVQERLVTEGPVPWTIVAATQFFDFPAMVVSWTVQEGTATVPPLLMQPVAITDVAATLAEVAVGPPLGRIIQVAGPEPQDLVDMARRTLAARGDRTRLVPTWRGTPLGVEMAGEVLLPGPDARIAPTTFDTWLAEQERASS